MEFLAWLGGSFSALSLGWKVAGGLLLALVIYYRRAVKRLELCNASQIALECGEDHEELLQQENERLRQRVQELEADQQKRYALFQEMIGNSHNEAVKFALEAGQTHSLLREREQLVAANNRLSAFLTRVMQAIADMRGLEKQVTCSPDGNVRLENKAA